MNDLCFAHSNVAAIALGIALATRSDSLADAKLNSSSMLSRSIFVLAAAPDAFSLNSKISFIAETSERLDPSSQSMLSRMTVKKLFINGSPALKEKPAPKM